METEHETWLCNVKAHAATFKGLTDTPTSATTVSYVCVPIDGIMDYGYCSMDRLVKELPTLTHTPSSQGLGLVTQQSGRTSTSFWINLGGDQFGEIRNGRAQFSTERTTKGAPVDVLLAEGVLGQDTVMYPIGGYFMVPVSVFLELPAFQRDVKVRFAQGPLLTFVTDGRNHVSYLIFMDGREADVWSYIIETHEDAKDIFINEVSPTSYTWEFVQTFEDALRLRGADSGPHLKFVTVKQEAFSSDDVLVRDVLGSSVPMTEEEVRAASLKISISRMVAQEMRHIKRP